MVGHPWRWRSTGSSARRLPAGSTSLSIPIFTGVVGWLINWTGLIMLFSPVRFHGVTVPGLRQLSRVLPRKVQEVPGLLQGGIGWQGIVPARAAKMGSIAVDKAIAKLGTPKEFYQQLEPDQIAEHIVAGLRAGHARDDRGASCRASTRSSGATSRRRRRQAVVARVQAQLPARRQHRHRRDRRAHRPAARPEDHGDQPLPARTRRWSSGSSATSASGS